MRRPRFIAEQARDAQGLLGRLIAFIMSKETWSDNKRVISTLAIKETDHVLDIGCGHGRSLPELASQTPKGRVAGTDTSDLMVEIATGGSANFVRSGRVEVVKASVEALPFTDASFDKIMSVHTVYFWPDLSRSVKEVARVLKPGGRLALLFRTDASKATEAFPAETYRFPSLDQMEAALVAAGLVPEIPSDAHESQKTTPVLVLATKA